MINNSSDFIDIPPAQNCKNPKSYGLVCVQCEKCGRDLSSVKLRPKICGTCKWHIPSEKTDDFGTIWECGNPDSSFKMYEIDYADGPCEEWAGKEEHIG